MEVTDWVQVTTDSDPSSENGVWAFFKKVKVAVNKSGFEEMGRKISGHRQRLGLSLSVLGRCVTTCIACRIKFVLIWCLDGWIKLASHASLNYQPSSMG
jgi:hypothetical protein